MPEDVGHVYRVVKRNPDGMVFQRCTAFPVTLRQFKARQQYKRIRPEMRSCPEGHLFLIGGPGARGIFGFFRPSSATRKAILQQLLLAYGPKSKIMESLWDGGIPQSARG